MQAKLDYQVFSKKYTVGLGLQSKNEAHIEENHFSFDFQEKKLNHGEISYTGRLDWNTNVRPSVGLKLLSITVELPLPPYGKFSILQNGYQSWGFSTVYSGKEKDVSPSLQFLRTSQENIYTTHSGKKGDFQSEGMTVLYDSEKKQGFILGISEPGDLGVKFRVKLRENGELEAIDIIYDIFASIEFKNNQGVSLTPVKWIPIGEDIATALDEYGKSVGKKFGVKQNTEPVPTGWCSWYYYYTKISEKIILENLQEIKNKNLPLEFFQIDDGYQIEIGDWLVTNSKFPAGMKFLADEIKKVGLKPGIWLAPFLVRPKAEIFQTYPEAIIKDEEGKPVSAIWQPLWGTGHTFALDVTHPIALDYIETVFRTMTTEWGYNYLKLDFLYGACLDGVIYNSKLTPVQKYRNALERIRKVVGKNTFLLGCGAPMYPSIGYFDGMRISCDITPKWKRDFIRVLLKDKNALCTERALINGLYRAFMHRNFWLNDPDCLIVRKDKNKMNYDQTVLMATVMGLSGGMLLMSDNLSTIDTGRLPVLLKAIELSKLCQGARSIPLGLMENKFPVGFYNSSGVLGIWNPTDKTKEIEVFFPYAFDFDSKNNLWTGQSVEMEFAPETKILKTKLGPYGSWVLGPNT
jgi:alpha-galactosidase